MRISRTLDFDPAFFFSATALVAIGLLFIASATADDPGASYFGKQLLWIAAGCVVFALLLWMDYHSLGAAANVLYVILLLALVWLLLFGKLTARTQSWITFGAFSIQPSEFMKVVTAVCVAYWCAESHSERMTFLDFLVPLFYVGVPMALVARQPDMGGAISFLPILGCAWFLSGIRIRTLVIVGVIVACLVPVAWVKVLKDYQRQRVVTYLDPESDPRGAGYHVMQSKIAIGSGGLVGKGVFRGTQSQLNFLPTQHTDFIFSVIAEETGFVGSAIVLFLYVLFLRQGVQAARLARDRLGVFLAMTLVSILAFHLLLNVGMVVGLLPTIGLPIPLLSYGGSSMVSTLAAVALIGNVRMRRFVN